MALDLERGLRHHGRREHLVTVAIEQLAAGGRPGRFGGRCRSTRDTVGLPRERAAHTPGLARLLGQIGHPPPIRGHTGRILPERGHQKRRGVTAIGNSPDVPIRLGMYFPVHEALPIRRPGPRQRQDSRIAPGAPPRRYHPPVPRTGHLTRLDHP